MNLKGKYNFTEKMKNKLSLIILIFLLFSFSCNKKSLIYICSDEIFSNQVQLIFISSDSIELKISHGDLHFIFDEDFDDIKADEFGYVTLKGVYNKMNGEINFINSSHKLYVMLHSKQNYSITCENGIFIEFYIQGMKLP
jgi:hypothetical protein